MKNNIFSNANQYVRERKLAGEVFVSSEAVKEWAVKMCDVDEADRNEFFDYYVNSMVTIAMNMNNCYSKERGEGVYVNVDACCDRVVLEQLLGYADKDIVGDSSRYAVIKRRLRQLDFEQMFMNLDNPSAPIQTVGEAMAAAV